MDPAEMHQARRLGLKAYRHFQGMEGRSVPVGAYTFTVAGGVSPPPYSGLNLSAATGDALENVVANRRLVERFIGHGRVRWLRQVHSSIVVKARRCREEICEGDGMVTVEPGEPLGVLHADCLAVVLYDLEKGVLANVHAGWRGLASGVLEECVSLMRKDFGAAPSSIAASLSPSIGQCCYEFKGWRELLPEWMHRHVKGGRLDLAGAAVNQLVRLGLERALIACSSICTSCSAEFHSHRRDGAAGRCATVAVIEEERSHGAL